MAGSLLILSKPWLFQSVLLYEVSMDLGSLGKWTSWIVGGNSLNVSTFWPSFVAQGASLQGCHLCCQSITGWSKTNFCISFLILVTLLDTKYDHYFTCTIIIADEQHVVNDKLTHNNDDGPHAQKHPVVVVITADSSSSGHRTWYYYPPPPSLLSCVSARIPGRRVAAARRAEN